MAIARLTEKRRMTINSQLVGRYSLAGAILFVFIPSILAGISSAQAEGFALSSSPSVIKEARQVRELSSEKAKLGYLVQLHAVVTYVDANNGDL